MLVGRVHLRNSSWTCSVFTKKFNILGSTYNSESLKSQCSIVLISHVSKVMLKILQARLQQYVNWEFLDVQAGFRKGRGIRDKIANICWIIEKAREFRKTSTFVSLTTLKPLTVWITTNCGKFLKRLEYQTTLPASWETCGHGTMEWFKIGKGVCQGCVLSPCLFNLHAEYIMWNVRLKESQAGIKIAGRNINKPQICRWYYLNGRKGRGTEEPLGESERGEWKSWLQAQHSKN